MTNVTKDYIKQQKKKQETTTDKMTDKVLETETKEAKSPIAQISDTKGTISPKNQISDSLNHHFLSHGRASTQNSDQNQQMSPPIQIIPSSPPPQQTTTHTIETKKEMEERKNNVLHTPPGPLSLCKKHNIKY